MRELIKNEKQFVDKLFKELEKLPFGALPKTELELVILHSMIVSMGNKDESGYDKVKDNFVELRNVLKLSKVQLQNKILNAQLRYDKPLNESDIINLIFRRIKEKKYASRNNQLIIQVFNPMHCDNIKTYLETQDVIIDTSFSNNILKIDDKSILYLLGKYFKNNKEIEEFQTNIKKLI